MLLLDSTVSIDVLHGREEVRDRLLEHDPQDLGVPAMVRGELMVGACQARDGHAERFMVERLLAPIPTIDFDARCASGYGVLRVLMQQRGRTLGVADGMIAATAILHDATLITSDARGFTDIPGLIVEDWRAA